MDTIPTTDPKVAAVINDAAATEQLAVAIAQAIKTQGLAGAIALAPRAIPQITQDIADVKAAMPVIKSGFKTSEFWVASLTTAALVAIPMVTHQPVSTPVASAIGALGAVYIAVRGLLKASPAAKV